MLYGKEKFKFNSEKAASLLPKTWLEAQKSLESDLKLMSQGMLCLKGPLTNLADNLNRELDSFKRASLQLGTFSTSQPRPGKVKEIEKGSFTSITDGVEDRIRKSLRSWCTGLQKEGKISFAKTSIFKFGQPSLIRAFPTCVGIEDQYIMAKQQKEPFEFLVDWKEMKQVLQRWKSMGLGKKAYSVEEWEPIRRLRISLIELEMTVAASNSPRQFFDNLRKTEIFENTKRTLSIPMSATSHEEEIAGRDLPPLDVPELLESLVRQSEPLLEQLGIQKGFSNKICAVLRGWKHPNDSQSLVYQDMSLLFKEAGKAADELDLKITSVLNSTGYKYKDDPWGRGPLITEELAPDKHSITIATTASLPWMTGTAINPLFRAAYLARDGDKSVTLLVPWLCKKDQELVYPNHMTFDSPQDQEKYIREWLSPRISFQPDFKIVFYPGKFSKSKRSILAVDDITQFIPNEEAEIAILEEPEHLTWYHHGTQWTRKFQHVVGVVHTNYLEYVRREKNGPFQAFLLKYVNNWVTNIYCHKVVRLSAATQKLPKSTICNVHGVSTNFLKIGQAISAEREEGHQTFTKGAYFLGKMVWGKGYRELLDLWAEHNEELRNVELDVFGNGEDSFAVKEEAKKQGLRIHFNEGRDHADSFLQGYKVFINPSVSDVLCTTTAEALAMGKIVVCANHPSNEFFKCFSNCLMYKSSEDFVKKVKQAMSLEPLPLTPEQQHVLSWEAATQRFLQSTDLVNPPLKGSKTRVNRHRHMHPLRSSLLRMNDVVDYGMFLAHYCLSGMEVARVASGAIPGTVHMDEEQRRDLGLALTAMKSEFYHSF